MATVPASRTWTAGEVVLDSHFNTNIRDVLNFLLARPELELNQTVAQTLTSGVGAAVTFTTGEVVDSSGMHSTSVNTSRATAVYPGFYREWGGVGFVANATGHRLTWFKANAGDVNGSLVEIQAATGGATTAIVVRTKTTFLNVGDYVELFALQSAGGNLNTTVATIEQSNFGMEWVSN